MVVTPLYHNLLSLNGYGNKRHSHSFTNLEKLFRKDFPTFANFIIYR